jgi:ribosomal protein L40E
VAYDHRDGSYRSAYEIQLGQSCASSPISIHSQAHETEAAAIEEQRAFIIEHLVRDAARSDTPDKAKREAGKLIKQIEEDRAKAPTLPMAEADKQQVTCAFCGWSGDSPVKKLLKVEGRDYPIECRACGAIGLRPVIQAEEAAKPDWQTRSLDYDDYLAYALSTGIRNPASNAQKWNLHSEHEADVRQLLRQQAEAKQADDFTADKCVECGAIDGAHAIDCTFHPDFCLNITPKKSRKGNSHAQARSNA